jgi:uracil-DNA glycosylase family 4
MAVAVNQSSKGEKISVAIAAAEKPASVAALEELNARIVGCARCERLRLYCADVARTRRRAYLDWEYWGRPVPSFGDPLAQVLVVGLAPGAHGSNRTGRPFTGDGSGDFLYPVLHEAGFASQPQGRSREDDMQLINLRINSVVRCAPPGNKPLPEEIRNCAPWLDEEILQMPGLRVLVCLGKIAFDGVVAHLLRTGRIASRAGWVFGHGAEQVAPATEESRALRVLASYHPSLQNTNTGKLTRGMFLEIFKRARELAATSEE